MIMAETKELTCIGCPMGCQLEVEMDGTGVTKVTGFLCKKGELYAKKEVTDPRRIVTSIIPVIGGDSDMVSVKTQSDIPKSKMRDCVIALKGLTVTAPIQIGDILLENVCGTNVCIIATKAVGRRIE